MWVIAEIYEQDLAFVKVGRPVARHRRCLAGRAFKGKVTFIYPTSARKAARARLRIEVDNPDGRLRADMAATVEIMTPLDGRRLSSAGVGGDR